MRTLGMVTSRSRTGLILVGMVTYIGLPSACVRQPAQSASQAPLLTDVPRVAPDTVPQGISNSVYHPGRTVRDIVLILFKDDASMEDRRRAVSLVAGTVIGGMPQDREKEGWYVVRVPRASSEADLFLLIDKVLASPGVKAAETWTMAAH
jgi:hypothetical protein